MPRTPLCRVRPLRRAPYNRHRPPRTPASESDPPRPPLLRGRFGIDSTLIRHRNRVESGNRCRIDVKSMPNRPLRRGGRGGFKGGVRGGLCLNPSQSLRVCLKSRVQNCEEVLVKKFRQLNWALEFSGMFRDVLRALRFTFHFGIATRSACYRSPKTSKLPRCKRCFGVCVPNLDVPIRGAQFAADRTAPIRSDLKSHDSNRNPEFRSIRCDVFTIFSNA